MFKIASVSGAPPQTPLGSLRRSPRPPSREGLLAFGNRSFEPSAHSPQYTPQTKKTHPTTPQNQNPRTATGPQLKKCKKIALNSPFFVRKYSPLTPEFSLFLIKKTLLSKCFL